MCVAICPSRGHDAPSRKKLLKSAATTTTTNNGVPQQANSQASLESESACAQEPDGLSFSSGIVVCLVCFWSRRSLIACLLHVCFAFAVCCLWFVCLLACLLVCLFFCLFVVCCFCCVLFADFCLLPVC